ncbi:hypothetical protein IWX49DRAFT_276744 [Phyllosticta citricarpa]
MHGVLAKPVPDFILASPLLRMSIKLRKRYSVKLSTGSWAPADSRRGKRHIRKTCPRDQSKRDVDVVDLHNISASSLEEIIRLAYERKKPPWPSRLKKFKRHSRRSSTDDATVRVDERTEQHADAGRAFGSSDLTSAPTTTTRDHDARDLSRSTLGLSPIQESPAGPTPTGSLYETSKPKQQRQAPVCTCKCHQQGENHQSRHHHRSQHSSPHPGHHNHHGHHHHHHHHHQHSNMPGNSSKPSVVSNGTPRCRTPRLHSETPRGRRDRRTMNRSDPTGEPGQTSRPQVSVSGPTTPGGNPNARSDLPNRIPSRPPLSRNASRQSSRSSLRTPNSAIAEWAQHTAAEGGNNLGPEDWPKEKKDVAQNQSSSTNRWVPPPVETTRRRTRGSRSNLSYGSYGSYGTYRSGHNSPSAFSLGGLNHGVVI